MITIIEKIKFISTRREKPDKRNTIIVNTWFPSPLVVLRLKPRESVESDADNDGSLLASDKLPA